MSTLMTERRRPLDNDDGQESLFGGEAFAAGPPAPTPWEREQPRPAGRAPTRGLRRRPICRSTPASATSPRPNGGRAASTPGAAEGESAPVDEGQYLTRLRGGAVRRGPRRVRLTRSRRSPTEVPAHDAGEELAALERATVGARRARAGSRATLAGPTLDDVMSRAWEGLVTGLPAACPVCRRRGRAVVRRVGARQLLLVRDDDRIASGTR